VITNAAHGTTTTPTAEGTRHRGKAILHICTMDFSLYGTDQLYTASSPRQTVHVQPSSQRTQHREAGRRYTSVHLCDRAHTIQGRSSSTAIAATAQHSQTSLMTTSLSSEHHALIAILSFGFITHARSRPMPCDQPTSTCWEALET